MSCANMDSLLLLANNPIEIFEETSRILLKIADNIIREPGNLKMRILLKSNSTIGKKVVSVPGGMACLIAMGFKENDQSYTLPIGDSLNSLKTIRLEISRLRESGGAKTEIKPEQQAKDKEIATKPTTSNTASATNSNKSQSQAQPSSSSHSPGMASTPSEHQYKRIILPPYTSRFKNFFLRDIEYNFNRAILYANTYLKQRALSAIPVTQLEEKAQTSLRLLQEKIKKDKVEDPEMDLQDFFILALLDWFKNDFFTWIDNPECHKCQGKTYFSHMCTLRALLKYTDRVEMHKCDICKEFTPFPRYNDLNILLETRKGRCGEWANTFTLMACAMGWDARFVMDQTDHVWTEIYSHSQNRWLHCDPCENVCDKPLMYESGWKKTVSYVMAYSSEEVQDVTWRYSSQHKQVLTRRKKCPENQLVEAIGILRDYRQRNMSASRKQYLTKRFLAEVIELMVEKQPTDKDAQGRTSGCLDWRVLRGEVSQPEVSKFVWEFATGDVQGESVSLQYSSALDQYQKTMPDGNVQTFSKWNSGVFDCDGLFRKEEKDWKKTYICRQESKETGHITWKFKITDKNYVFDNIDYTIAHSVFEKGSVSIKMCDKDNCLLITTETGTTEMFKGSDEFTISAKLSGDKNANDWQHAQLFREDLDGDEEKASFKLTFRFKKLD